MLIEKDVQSANYLRIVAVLRNLRDSGKITVSEYKHAKKYYFDITGADIIIND